MHDIARLAAMKLVSPFELNEIAGLLGIGDRPPLVVPHFALVRCHQRAHVARAIVGAVAVASKPKGRVRPRALQSRLHDRRGFVVRRQSLTVGTPQHGHAVNVETVSIRAGCDRKREGAVPQAVFHNLTSSVKEVVVSAAVIGERDLEEANIPALGPILHQVIPFITDGGELITATKLIATFVLDHNGAIARDIIDHRTKSRPAAKRCHFDHGRLAPRGKAGKACAHGPIGATLDAVWTAVSTPAKSKARWLCHSGRSWRRDTPSPAAALILFRQGATPERQIMEQGCLALLPFSRERAEENLHQTLPTRLRAPRSAKACSSNSTIATTR
ncbi:hypothetical protein [Rhizobium leguminosarum]